MLVVTQNENTYIRTKLETEAELEYFNNLSHIAKHMHDMYESYHTV